MTKKRNKIIIAVLVFAAVVFIINACRAEFSPYKKEFAKIGTYVESVEADALIVRDETVLEKGATGVLKSEVAEGERVKAFARLGAIVAGNIDSAKMNELNELNTEIEVLSQAVGDAGLLAIDESKIDTTLDTTIENLRYSVAKNDSGTAVSLCDNVRILTERKAGVTTTSEAQQELEALIARRDSVAESLGGSHRAIYAPEAGLYSSHMDGLETVLTFENIKNITPEQIDTYFDKIQSYKAQGPCKIINNYKWYIVLNLTEAECEGLRTGKSYGVIFTDLGETETDGVVTNISKKDKDGRCAVTMEFDKHVDNFTVERETRVQIIKEKYSGIYIPRSAIRVDGANGVQGVWVQNEVELEFRSIVEVYRDDEFVLAKENAEGQDGYKNIALYDGIVLNPDK